MNWRELFSPGANISPDEVRMFMAAHDPQEYQLLDVRQPKEYRKGHLAGAIHIPVKELSERLDELDPALPILVYCRSGVRSKAAAQLLLGSEYPHVFNMSGGIIAYAGDQKARGNETIGIELFVAGEFADVFRLGYAMEHALEQLYSVLAENSKDEKLSELLLRLATFEKGHKAKLVALFPKLSSQADLSLSTLEGGFDRQQILDHFQDQLNDPNAIIQLAMMFETQAFDLYSRLAKQELEEDKKDFFEHMRREEKQHLRFLSREYDNILE